MYLLLEEHTTMTSVYCEQRLQPNSSARRTTLVEWKLFQPISKLPSCNDVNVYTNKPKKAHTFSNSAVVETNSAFVSQQTNYLLCNMLKMLCLTGGNNLDNNRL